jgi:hypothetical protein
MGFNSQLAKLAYIESIKKALAAVLGLSIAFYCIKS